MNMNTEPIRLPALIAATLIVVLTVAVALLLDLDADAAAALVLTAFGASGVGLAYAESRRARTDSPATVQGQLEQIDAQYEALYGHAEAGHGEEL